jgi:hypothetical protein
MTHLSDEQIAGATDGIATPAVDGHLAACTACAARVTGLRALLRDVNTIDVPEPSPLFWEHFHRRVNESIDTPVHDQARWRWTWAAAAATAIVVLVVALVSMLPLRPTDDPTQVAGSRPEEHATPDPSPDSTAALDITDINEDEAWAVVRSLAEELHYDDAREAGVMPSAGALDRAATELTEEERAELVRLISNDLKRAGA